MFNSHFSYFNIINPKFISWDYYKQYIDKEPPFGTIGAVVFLRTYSHYIPELERREYWCEVVLRCVEFSLGLEDKTLFPQQIEEAQVLFDLWFNLKAFPAGRTLWVGHPKKDLKEANFNCFAIETEFVTRQGLKRFSDFKDEDSVEVLTRFPQGARVWKKATVKKFGKEKLYKLKLGRGKAEKEIYTTLNHRWLVRSAVNSFTNVVEKITLELKLGDRIPVVRAGQMNKPNPCSIAIQHGIVFGDGTFVKKCGATRIDIQEGKLDLISFITSDTTLNQGSKGGKKSSVVTIDRLPYFWKTLPPLTANKEYLLGFIMGWFATDGSLSNGCSSISNKSEEALEWLRSALSILGIYTSKVRLLRVLNPYTGEDSPCYSLTIYKEYLESDFFIREVHKNTFEEGQERGYWTVTSVEETDRIEDVWCVQEPATESFVLSDGILTRNCSFRVIDSIEAYQEMCHLLMVGVGVGFSVEEKYIKSFPKLNNKLVIHKPYKYKPLIEKTVAYLDNNFPLIFKEEIHKAEHVLIRIGDSREGWETALLYYLYSFSSNSVKTITVDYNSVRPHGTSLKTMGGRASGPKPLELLFKKINWIIFSSNNSQLNSVDLTDIATCLAEAIVVGGVRRSSLIALSDSSDTNFKVMKTGLWDNLNLDLVNTKLKLLESLNSDMWDINGYYTNPNITEAIDTIDLVSKKFRWRTSRVMSNNSIMLDEFEETEMIKIFDSISHNGEPGFINRKVAESKRPLFKGVNPCFSGDMRLLTSEGYQTFEDLENTEPLIFNKNYNYTKGKVWCSGVKETIKLILNNGSDIVCTPDHVLMTSDHREIEAKDSLNEKLMTLAHPLNMTVIKILPNKPIKVYDFTEPETHWGFVENILVHNCAEILLDNQGVCNLVEINVLAFVNENNELEKYELNKALVYSTKHCSRITEITFWDKEWDQVQKRDRLLGVSLTGVVEAFNKLNYSDYDIEEFYLECNEVVNKTAFIYHKFLGIPFALLTTCIKPSGTLSNLPGVSSGIHAPYAPYYIRRVRVSANDPIAKVLRDLKVPVVPENGYPDLENSPIWVFSFYVKTNANHNSSSESAITQLERYKQVMNYYVEHNCSITVTFKEHEVPEIINWLNENKDTFVGVSFLPSYDGVYPNLPYEAISKEQYENNVSNSFTLSEKELNQLISYYEKEENEYELEQDCNSGSCPVR